MKPIIKNIPVFYLFALLAGILFFIPAIFVDRFTTAPSLWMQMWIGICAFFSYPFNYPFIRLMAVAFLAFALSANSQQSITLRNGYLPKGIAILF